MVQRVYVEKRRAYAVRAAGLMEEFTSFLGVKGIMDVRCFIRYDVENISKELFERALNGVFAEPPLDHFYLEELPKVREAIVIAVEPNPGQFDLRADSAAQCLKFIDKSADPVVRCADVCMVTGDISKKDIERIKGYLVNPVETRIAANEKPYTLNAVYDEPDMVEVLKGFISLDEKGIAALHEDMSLAMTRDDLLWIRDHFRDNERRDPTITEIRVLDTYWSDHCRHTTFSTELTSVSFSRSALIEPVRETYRQYKQHKGKGTVCLMDVALAGMRALKRSGALTDMEDSEENNACSVIVDIPVTKADGTTLTESWLLFFKNETHNHPTEIEPFGGAATCLGGAIRDPLSGRGYVYQAMRVTGAASPLSAASETLPGKLPQKKIVREAARGYSSYGNQIGLATGYVREIYHPGYVAKRMEIGAVIGAAKKDAVRRVRPGKDDVVILLGGRTGRDGIGGATGSSKSHTAQSLTSCGAEVQKGNAPTERKIQRMFRREEVTKLILKCNDFGAGGVAVAVGELSDGLLIDLDAVPRKYEGLDGTELAISESQERMAVVVSPDDVSLFLQYAEEENLEATVIARVTDDGRLVMRWKGETIVDIDRAFLDTNGAPLKATAHIGAPARKGNPFKQPLSDKVGDAITDEDFRTALLNVICDLNVCSQRGLVEMFDSTIGAGSVFMPFGGRQQLTPAEAMVARFPVKDGVSKAVSMMAYGFDPYLSEWSPYHGAVYAVIQSVSKLIACGTSLDRIHLTLQEYFRRMDDNPAAYGEVLSALLGAFEAQMRLNIAAIGGKDSMSGTFDNIHVPPTLVSFAVGTGYSDEVISPEFKRPGNTIVEFKVGRDKNFLPDYDDIIRMYNDITGLMREGLIVSCQAEDANGLAACAAKMAFGNGLGIVFEETLKMDELFGNGLLNIVAEVTPEGLSKVLHTKGAMKVGTLNETAVFIYRDYAVLLPEALQCFNSKLERIYPVSAPKAGVSGTKTVKLGGREDLLYHEKNVYVCKNKIARPKVFIPVFPGTNCEYDLERAFNRAGADTVSVVFKNLNAAAIEDSFKAFTDAVDGANIIMFPGGFSAGDEPDGSAKFFATAFRNEHLKDSVMRLLNERDGLVLGICNGFQALIKLGLVPYGDIRVQSEKDPTLTYNTIGRHISRMAHIRVTSDKSPWLSLADPGEIYISPISHGEGRFVADEETYNTLYANGQIATGYCDMDGNITMDDEWNLNGSYGAIEGITSADGRCYGKMAHAERTGENIAMNVPGVQDMKIFEAGVRYFQ